MTQKFTIHEIVEIQSMKANLKTICGKKGIIQGVSENEEEPGSFAYAVEIPYIKQTVFIREDDLKATGKTANPDTVQTDMHLRVDKEGNILED